MYEVQGRGSGTITECASGEHCLRSAATEAETPLETSRLISIKINNASVYKAQISPRSPKVPPGAKPLAQDSGGGDRDEVKTRVGCGSNGVRKQ